jgi:hypothetical protein
VRAAPDGGPPERADDPQMSATYAVVWHEGSGPQAVGKLELLPHSLRLDGLAARPTTLRIPYDAVAVVRLERVDGRPTVVLERRDELPVRMSTVVQPSLAGEVAGLLGARSSAAAARRSPAR